MDFNKELWQNHQLTGKPYPVPDTCTCTLRNLPDHIQGYTRDKLNHDIDCNYRIEQLPLFSA